MDRDELIRRADKAIQKALARPLLAGLDADDERALRGLKRALAAEPDIADRVIPYVNQWSVGESETP